MHVAMRAVRSLCPLLILAGLGLAGCAKPPSGIDVQITADDTVPLVTLLRSTVVRASAPAEPSVRKWVSPGGADPDSGISGFGFPLLLHVNIHPSWEGPVTLTVDGLDFYVADKVIATGTTEATVVKEQTTTVSLSLTGVFTGGGGGDGGTGGEAGSDGGVTPDDAGGDDAAAD